MRRLLSFDCEGDALVATLDEAGGTTGLLIVSGGNEIRIGAHRGMAKLAAAIATAGHPVFRFDRRGIGDSEGENGGFQSSAPDIAAAIAAFRTASPSLERIVAFGNCDAASALVLHAIAGIDALVLANPWVIETEDDMPPPAAIRARYAGRMRDPAAWRALFTGGIDLRKLAAGLVRVARPAPPSALTARVAERLATIEKPVTILACKGDATAIAFLDEWADPSFERARARPNIDLHMIDSDSHSFANDVDFTELKAGLLTRLRD